MKKKDKYKIINYAKNKYSKFLECDFEFKYISLNKVKELLSTYKHPNMCEWLYCCNGLYESCWQDPFVEGIWGMSQEQVNKIIYNIFKDLSKQCRREPRIIYCKKDGDIQVVIIARDLNPFKADYLISFTNER